MPWRMDCRHPCDGVAILQQNIGREGGIGAQMEGVGGGAGSGLEGGGRTEMIRMGMTEEDC